MRRRGSAGTGAGPLTAALAALMALASCAPEAILQGTRFPIRAPLALSQPSDANPDPQPPEAPANQARTISLPAPVANADYPQRGGGATHAGVSAVLSTPPVLAWSVPIGHGNSRQNRVSATPVVAGGRVFTLDALDRLDAVSVTGQPLWSVDLTASFDRGGDVSGGGLAATAGAVYAATGYGEVVAVKADTGAVLWRQRLDVPAAGAPTIAGDALYVMGRDGTGWAIRLSDGKVQWTVPGVDSIGGILGGAAPATDGRVVLLPLPSGSLLAVTPAGDPLWSAPITGERLGRGYTLLGDITGDPVIRDGYVYVGTAAGRTAALGLADGSRLWDATEGALNPPLVVGGSVFVVSDENRLVRMDAWTGETIWAVDLPYYTTTKEKRRKAIHASYGPVLAGGHVVVVSSDGLLRAFNATDGSLAGTADIPGGAASAPALAGGQLFVVSTRGQLLAFR
jgi:outer membrane protein assembly factor BamB